MCLQLYAAHCLLCVISFPSAKSHITHQWLQASSVLSHWTNMLSAMPVLSLSHKHTYALLYGQPLGAYESVALLYGFGQNWDLLLVNLFSFHCFSFKAADSLAFTVSLRSHPVNNLWKKIVTLISSGHNSGLHKRWQHFWRLKWKQSWLENG